MRVHYYNANDVYLGDDVSITETRTTYTVIGEALPTGGIKDVEFQCADQLGTFYVKILEITVKDRWGKWVAEDATATLEYSVDDDGVCTITVGGTAQPNNGDRWKASAVYEYTAKADKSYEYKFEAWTKSGTRDLRVQYYNNYANDVYLGDDVSITATRTTYTVIGEALPTGGIQYVEFQSADKLGTFYVKILGINVYEGDGDGGGGIPSTPPIGEITGTITLTDVPSSASVWIFVNVYNEDYSKYYNGDSSINLGSGSGTLSNLSWSIPIYGNDGFFASTGNFGLYVSPTGSDNGFNINIPTTPSISNANANVGSLGTVSLKYITLSGTINVTYNGQTVPIVEIRTASSGFTTLTSPGSNASWTIYMPPLSSSTPVHFGVSGYTNNQEQLFSKDVASAVEVYNTNITGITLNLGNISKSP